MKLPFPLQPCTLIRRYKRFLTDVRLESGEEVTAHCPNSGSMRSCFDEGWVALVSHHDDPKRKLAYTLQFVHNGNCWICVNTHLGNQVVGEALRQGQVPELAVYGQVTAEKRYGTGTRFDFFLEQEGEPPAFVEVKTVSLLSDEGHYAFPDAVTTRGQKHLDALIQVKKEGMRAVQFYLIQRSDAEFGACAHWIDPDYSRKLDEAREAGVEVLCFESVIEPPELCLGRRIPWGSL